VVKCTWVRTMGIAGTRGYCPGCQGPEVTECLHCFTTHGEPCLADLCTKVELAESCPTSSGQRAKIGSNRCRCPGRAGMDHDAMFMHIEALVCELFWMHDLNSDGLLDEDELIRLNQKIAVLHHGKHADPFAIEEKYRGLFRTRLNPKGEPVPFQIFRAYAMEVLWALDPDDLEAQEMILEQFVAEARSGRQACELERLACEVDLPLKGEVLPRLLEKVTMTRPPSINADLEADAALGLMLPPEVEGCCRHQIPRPSPSKSSNSSHSTLCGPSKLMHC